MAAKRKLDHIGIAVADLDQAIAQWRVLGFDVSHIEDVPSQKVRVAFLPLGEAQIELLAPTAEDSPIAKFLAKRGPGMHHLSLRVDDIQAELARIDAAGGTLIDNEPRAGAHQTQVAFLHPKTASGVLVEFSQHSEDK